MDKKVNRICLNMIVKNESRVILRLLESVANLIDYYCICDTGSTDDTIQIIQDFFNSKNIRGKIATEPFQDFGYNRTFAMKLCDEFAETEHIDYLLLLDADMYLSGPALFSPNTFKQSLGEADVYYLFQGSERFYYKNARLARPNRGYSYWGVTHEYVKTPESTKYEAIDKDKLFICDIGDGGSKNDKFERDIRLLEKGLETEPNNDRYTFYLANSYRDAGHIEKAIETFKKRIQIGGWIEEVWHSYYSIGKCYMKLGNMPNAIFWWMEGFNYYPKRIENLYEIVQYYRVESKHALSYLWYIIADTQRKKYPITSDYLFLQKDIYDFKLDFELSIIGYYTNTENFDLRKSSIKVISDPNVDENIIRNVFSNYKFYSKKLIDSKTPVFDSLIKVLETVGESQEIENEYLPSTPSICIHNEYVVVNRRYVNYRIDEQGNYVNQRHIKTKNIIGILKKDVNNWTVLREFVMPYKKALDNIYVGLEDVRIMSHKSSANTPAQLLYHANRGLDRNRIAVESGEIFLGSEMAVSCILQRSNPKVKDTEKNWVLVPRANCPIQPKVIYGWSPLTIGEIRNQTEFIVSTEETTPTFFRHLRGSTNGVIMYDEIWFIGHLVSYEDRRYYYHMFIVLDYETLQLKKYSLPFTFEGDKVEYTLGFIHMKSDDNVDNLLIGYSIMDSETRYLTIEKSVADDMMVIV
jgi:tetratricopeptide (TPR) repeat protein